MYSRRTNRPTECELCARVLTLTFHHLIPKKAHRRKRFKKQFDRDQLARGIWVCQPCHRAIHRTYSEIELAEQFNTLDALQEDPQLQRHVEWVRKQKRALT